MTLWALIRIIATLAVLAVVVGTTITVRHVRVEPREGRLAEWIPVELEARPMLALPEPAADSLQMDPGSKLFDKAKQMLAVGDLAGAEDRLRTIVSMYPRSGAAPEARRIVGEMNLDELLGPGLGTGKIVYKVRPGDSYLGIAAKHDTSLDLIMHFNGLMGLNSLQPGDELTLMPLNFRLLIEPERKALSLWDGTRFIKEFPVLASMGKAGEDGKTTINAKMGMRDGKRYQPANDGYRGAFKMLGLERPAWQITVLEEGADVAALAPGLYLSAEDMEELALLTRPGNEVEIRTSNR